MLDAQGRIAIGKNLLVRDKLINANREAKIFYDSIHRKLILRNIYAEEYDEEIYFIVNHKIDKKGRIFIPKSIRNAFPDATYLPVAKHGRIYILIIEHAKKSE